MFRDLIAAAAILGTFFLVAVFLVLTLANGVGVSLAVFALFVLPIAHIIRREIRRNFPKGCKS